MFLAIFLGSPPEQLGGELQFGEGDLADMGKGLRIVDPTFSGYTQNAEPFHFAADLAIPDAAPPNRAEIETLRGELALADGRNLKLAAKYATLEIPDQHMTLRLDITLESSDGLTATADEMRIDLAGSQLDADHVAAHTPAGTISAQHLLIRENTEFPGKYHFSFREDVRLIYTPPKNSD